MSLSPHQRGNINNIGKPNINAIEDPGQNSGEAFYNVGASSLEPSNSSAGARTDPSLDLQGSAVCKPDKGYQVWGHFQQSGPGKWVHQDPVHNSTWFPTKLTQNFGPSLSGMDDIRGHQHLQKSNPNMGALQQKMSAGSSVPYSEPSQAVVPVMEWEPHTMAAIHHAQFQGHKPGEQQFQSQAMRHPIPDSTLQSFQLAFGSTKQLQASSFFQGFQGNSASQNLGYSEQPKTQQQLLHQRQMHQQQMHHFQQQQQQQQRFHHMQQQYHHQQKMQEQMQQQQLQSFLQPSQPLHPDQRLARPQQLDNSQVKADFSTLKSHQSPSMGVQAPTEGPNPQSPANKDLGPYKTPQEQKETEVKPDVVPRRSRRLSRDGVSPTSNQPSKEPARNGGVGGFQGPSVGVIHSTQRRRRTSKEINLETLAQKASEMEFLPAKRDESTSARQTGMPPLVIPVSVPVQRGQAQPGQTSSWRPSLESTQQLSERKPSVIVTRRRSLRASDTFNQGEEKEDGQSPDKIRRRPRPEPLVIPPPRPCTFIAPSVYSSISTYQSHLRSPVRLLDNPLALPPYTPPPILSPVREGSGLYFSTFLSSIAVGNQGVTLPPTPKTASRSLLRASSSEITPPMPPLIGEATPVSLEPRINIGPRYQAEIPELRDQFLVQHDDDKATLVWVPLANTESSLPQEETVDHLMNLACSSVLYGGGANVELMHHCLYENRGDVLKTLEMLLLKEPIFSIDHHLSNYHYAGSDCWTVDEKHYFNKGISAYTKDFFLVQKVVQTKTLAQCVEFYYTYKKQVKVGRSGTLTYGPPDAEERAPEITQIKQEQPEVAEERKQREEREDDRGDGIKNVTKALQVSENEGKVLKLSNPRIGSLEDATALRRETQTPPLIAPKPHPETAARRSTPSGVTRTKGEPEGIFPCKKCTRVFFKVKSRSAHMKSHAEQEKKAAAQRLKEEEERLAAKARQEAAERMKMEAVRVGREESGAEESIEQDDWS